MLASPGSKKPKVDAASTDQMPSIALDDALRALRSTQTDGTSLQKAAAELYMLTTDSPSAATAALDAGAAELLCEVLRKGPDDAKRNAAAALYNLAQDAELAARTVEVGALEALVNVLTDGHIDASQNASAALYRFSQTDELASSILDAGAAPALIRILHRGTDVLRQHAAAALYALARSGPLAQRVIGAGAPCALFEVMQTSSAPAACEAACEALCALVRTPEHAAHVVDTGVVPGLIRMLASPCMRSQRLAACTISVLAAADEGGAIVAAGAVPIVVTVLLNGEPRAQEYAASALSNLASSFGPRSNFVEAGALPALIGAMRSGTPATCRSAVVALHHLTLDTPIGIFAVGAGAIPPVIAALSCGDQATEEAAAGVSYNLACESLVLGGQLIDEGLLQPLVNMLSADRHSDSALDLAAGAILSLAGEPTLRARVLSHAAVLLIVRIGARRPRGRALTLMDTLMSDSNARRQMLSALGREYETASAELQALRERNRQLEEAHHRLALAVDEAGADESGAEDRAGDRGAIRGACDVTLSFDDGRALHASKLLLAIGSNYFRAQLCGPAAAALPAPASPTVSTPPELHGAEQETPAGPPKSDELHSRFNSKANSPPTQRFFRQSSTGVVIRPDQSFSYEAYRALLQQLHSSGSEALPDDSMLVVELHALARKMSPMPTGDGASAAAEDLPDTLARVAAKCERRMIDGLDVDNCLDLLLHARACDGAHRLLKEAIEFVRVHLRAITALPRWQSFCAQESALALELMTKAAVSLDDELRGYIASPRVQSRKRRHSQSSAPARGYYKITS